MIYISRSLVVISIVDLYSSITGDIRSKESYGGEGGDDTDNKMARTGAFPDVYEAQAQFGQAQNEGNVAELLKQQASIEQAGPDLVEHDARCVVIVVI